LQHLHTPQATHLLGSAQCQSQHFKIKSGRAIRNSTTARLPARFP
jgi:hypothetical protein